MTHRRKCKSRLCAHSETCAWMVSAGPPFAHGRLPHTHLLLCMHGDSPCMYWSLGRHQSLPLMSVSWPRPCLAALCRLLPPCHWAHKAWSICSKPRGPSPEEVGRDLEILKEPGLAFVRGPPALCEHAVWVVEQNCLFAFRDAHMHGEASHGNCGL